MYNDWINEIISTKELPEYEFSPSPKSNDDKNKDGNKDGNKDNEENKDIRDAYNGVGEMPTSTAFIVTLFPVMMCIFFCNLY